MIKGSQFADSHGSHNRCARKVLVIGGGLAGLTAALELSKAGCDVTVLEASGRVGGKAGADLVNGHYEEHGLHLFPPWYVNTFRLAHELGIASRFVPIHRIHELQRGEFPKFRTVHQPTSLRSVLQNTVFGRVFPASLAIPLYAAVLQLASAPEEPNCLDSISVAEFFTSCAPGRSRVTAGLEAIIPKLLGTSSSELSAFAWQAAIRYWLRYRTPVFSILDGNLQQRFIEPFARELQLRGCRTLLHCRVERLLVDGNRMRGVVCRLGAERVTQIADAYLLATPAEVTADLLRDTGETLKPLWRRVHGLKMRPMGTMSIYLKRPLANLPPEHVMLKDSRLALGLIDVSQVWDDLSGCVLNLNIGEVAPILHLPVEHAAAKVFQEVAEYLPVQWPNDVAGFHIRTNADAPLLLSSPGCWANRPFPGPTCLAGLYVCGDFCRSAVRVVSVEGAVSSGITAAQEILKVSGQTKLNAVLEPESPSPHLLWVLRNCMSVAVALVDRTRKRSLSGRNSQSGFPCSQTRSNAANGHSSVYHSHGAVHRTASGTIRRK